MFKIDARKIKGKKSDRKSTQAALKFLGLTKSKKKAKKKKK